MAGAWLTYLKAPQLSFDWGTGYVKMSDLTMITLLLVLAAVFIAVVGSYVLDVLEVI